MLDRRWFLPYLFLFFFLCAGPLLGQPGTIEWTDDVRQPLGQAHEFSNVQLHATDPGRAGWGSVTARVTSDLRGDEETMTLYEDPGAPGTFWGEIAIPASLSLDPPQVGDGVLEVTEHSGPPLERDTIRAELLSCASPPCPTDAAPVAGSRVRFTDEQGADVDQVAWSANLEVTDYGIAPGAPATVTIVTQSGDSETVSLISVPWAGRFRGSIAVALGAPVAGNGRLDVGESDVLTASHQDPLGFATSIDTATVASGTIEFLDRQGRSAGHVLADGMLSLRVTFPAGNANPGMPEVVGVTVRSKGTIGEVNDTETIWLYESAGDSGVFLGQLQTRMFDSGGPGNWMLATFYDYINGGVLDQVEVSLLAAPVVATAPVVPAVVRFTDAAGADLNSFLGGDEVRLEVETELASNWIGLTVRSLTGGDEDYVTLYETGPDTFIFRGSIQSYLSDTAYVNSGTFEVLPAGELVRAEYVTQYGTPTDSASSGDGDPNTPPPVAVADTASTPDGLPVSVEVLYNDVAGGAGPLQVTAFSQGNHEGAVALGANGLLTYTPQPAFVGNESFTYRVTNARGDSAQGTVTVTVYAVNEPPTAVDDAFTIDEEQGRWLEPLANDTDPENEGVFFDGIVSDGHLGIVNSVDWATGRIQYLPYVNAYGTDTVTYRVSDPLGATDTATITITINNVPDAPYAVGDQASTDEDVPVLIDVLANDSDIDGDAFQITAVIPVSNGTPVVQNGRVLFTPTADFNGAARFRYTITDATNRSTTATVDVTVRSVADSPTAVPDAATTAEETAVNVDVLANDRDGDGDALSLSAVGTAGHGTVSVNGQRALYTPAANYFGGDSFTYTVSDTTGRTATGTVTVTVSNVQDAPVAVADQATTAEDTAATIAVLVNDSDADGDSLAIVAVSQGGKGSVAIAGANVTYTPNANANGADSFTYTAGDGHGGTATATVAVTIDAVNDAPDAVNDSAGTNEDTAVTIAVRANDSDVDGEAVTLVSVTQGTRGSVAANADGTVTYTPNANTNGADSFGYTIRDAAGLTDSATVVVAVAAVNDAPVAVNDSGTTDEGSAVVIAVLANDSDLDGGPLAVTAVTSPAHGTAAITGNGTTVTYTPVSTYVGADSFSYTVSDGSATAGATVSIQVKEALRNVAVLATHGAWLQARADVLSGDVIVNAAGSAPFLNGGVELYVAGNATTAAGWDVEANRVTLAAGAVVSGDVYYNQLTNGGTIGGALVTPLALPVFASLPAFLDSTPGSTDVSVANSGTRTLAPGSYRDLIVGRKATVTFTGGIYHFRSVQVERESKLLFSAASQVRVQQKVSTGILTTIGPGSGSSATAASIVFYVAGVNGTSGGLAATPKAVDIGADNAVSANLYAPNGTLWLRDGAQATGSLIARDVQVGADAQVALSSAW